MTGRFPARHGYGRLPLRWVFDNAHFGTFDADGAPSTHQTLTKTSPPAPYFEALPAEYHSSPLSRRTRKPRSLFLHYLEALGPTRQSPRHAQPLQDTEYWYQKRL